MFIIVIKRQALRFVNLGTGCQKVLMKLQLISRSLALSVPVETNQ